MKRADKINEFKKRIQARLNETKEKRRRCAKPEPRYDAVFEEGVKQLGSIANCGGIRKIERVLTENTPGCINTENDKINELINRVNELFTRLEDLIEALDTRFDRMRSKISALYEQDK